MSDHTPWPWRKGISMDGLFVEGGNRGVVCRMISFDREDDLDLIISAPDLLKALDVMVKAFKTYAPESSGEYNCVVQARAAIAKATGGQYVVE